MPFCTNCGTTVDPSASYCANCGTPQLRARTPQYTDALHGINERTASILCYIPVVGVIPAIVFLASQKFRHNLNVRFNAFQSVYLSVAWLIVTSALPTLILGMHPWGPEHSLVGLLKACLIGCWIYLLINARREKHISLPILGELAARSANEQL